MATEQTNGIISKTKGQFEELIGKLTGNRKQQVKGQAHQAQGDAQTALGDVQDTVRAPESKTS